MSNKQRYLSIIGVIGSIVLFLLMILVSRKFRIYRYFSLISIAMILCIVIISLIMLERCEKTNLYWLLKILSIGHLVRSLISLAYIYMYVIKKEAICETPVLFLQSQCIEIVNLVMIIRSVIFKKRNLNSTFFLVLIELIGCTYCLLLNPLIATASVKIIRMFSLVVLIYMLKNLRTIQDKYFGIHLKIMSLYILAIGFQYMNVLRLTKFDYTSYIYLQIFGYMQVVLILFDIYYIGIKKPWQDKMIVIEKVNHQLERQSKICQNIVNLSHELKTPINVIKSALTILEMDFKQTPINDDIVGVKKECRYLMNIIQDMIDIQKVRTGCMQLSCMDYNLIELLESVIDAFGEEGYSGKIIFDPYSEEMCVLVDKDCFQQTFMLLIGLLLERNIDKPIYIEVKEDNKKGMIDITFMQIGINEICKQVKAIEKLQGEIEEYIDRRMTVELILLLIQIEQGEIYFDEQEGEACLHILFQKYQQSETDWKVQEDTEYIRECVRCRYQIS